jgi:SAM-dependent methyltransferase
MSSPPDEPLRESAPLARRLAPQRCWLDPRTGERCDWQHGLWQTLRLLGLITTPVHHAEFFRRSFAALAPGARILVSGTADYAMLAQVLAGARSPRVTVLDVCATSVELNRWYAQRAGVAVDAVCSDVLAFTADARFDMICTHSFIGQFDPASRARLVRSWHEWLAPGGRLVTINRVRPGAGPPGQRVGFSAEQAKTFVATVLERARPRAAELGLDLAALEPHAARYAAHQGAWPVRSLEEIRALFEGAGFALEHLESALVPGEHGRVSGPTTPGGAASYAHILALRR